MGVDQVKVEAFVDHAANRRLHRLRQQEGRDAHADFRQHRVTRVRHLDPVAHFVARRFREARVVAEARIGRGEPGNRRHHARLHPAAGDQVAQARLDKDAVAGFFAVREQGTKGQDLHAAFNPVTWP